MAVIQLIDTTTVTPDGIGDTAVQGANKINENFNAVNVDVEALNAHNHNTQYDALGAAAAVQSALDALALSLSNVDNTSDADKPISTAQQAALDALLQLAIDNINTLLTSDDTTLDELQEIVDFIKLNKATLDALTIANIAGLQSALDTLQSSLDNHNHNGDYATAAQGAKADAALQPGSALIKTRQQLGTQAATSQWDMSNGFGGFDVTLSGIANIPNPTNKPALTAGQFITGTIIIRQDATGGYTPTWGTDFADVADLTVSTDPNAVTRFAWIMESDGKIYFGEPY